MTRRTAILVMTLILLLAAGLRLARLAEVPPGVTHDEAAHLEDAWRILHGARPIYLTSGYGREPLYDYATAPLLGLLGMRVVAGRLSSAVWGLALVALTYAALRGPLGRRGALGAALLMSVSFWPLSTSRQALRSITMPVLFAAAMTLFWHGLYRSRGATARLALVAAGVLLGLGFYTYMPARAMWAVPALLWLSLAVTDRRRFRDRGRDVLLMLVVMLLVAAPFLLYLRAHPGLEVRVTELAAPLDAALRGNAEPLLRQVRDTVWMFSRRGDVHWMYNLSGRPLLPPPLAVLLCLGLAVALLRAGRPGPRLLLLWLLVGVAPALLTGLESSSLRAIAAQPAVFGLCVLPLVELGRLLGGRRRSALLRRGGRLCLAGLFLALAGWVAVDSARAYFVTWASHRDVRVAYHAHLVEEAAFLDREAAGWVDCLSASYPARPHDPAAMAVLRGDVATDLRWFDGRGALVFPPTAQAHLLAPTSAPLDRALEELVMPHAQPMPPISLRPTDFVTQVTVLEWDAAGALDAALADALGPVATFPSDALPTDHAYQALELPVEVGGTLALVGYRLLTPAVEPGGELALVTFWRVHRAAPADLVLFAHLLDDESRVLGQVDRLDAPAWNWHAGDVLAQVHRFSISTAESAGRYHLQVGVYWRDGGERLPLLVGGRPVGSRILLQPVEVVAR